MQERVFLKVYFKSRRTWLLLTLLPCSVTTALWPLCSVKSPDFLKPLVLINPKSQQQLNVLRLYTTQATWTGDRFGAALMPTPGRGAMVKLQRKKSCGTYRTSTGPHRARGTCWASLSLQGTRVVMECLSSSPETATPGALYRTNPLCEDALPYLPVGRQDQEDQWDLHCPKQLEN